MSEGYQDDIRRIALIAMFSDDDLMNRLVLKGGNALDIVYGTAKRASFDLDFSIEGEFRREDMAILKAKISKVLIETFEEHSYSVFDITFEEKPESMPTSVQGFWGGYQIEFKVMRREKYRALSGNIDALRREALEVAPGHKRRLTIEISKFEVCSLKKPHEVDGYTVYVYPPEMLAIEKLRAICQQMPEYAEIVGKSHVSARARDFLDFHTVVEHFKLNLLDARNIAALKAVFEAKRVPLDLLGEVHRHREFHRPDFRAVMATVKPGTGLESFDFYLDFVVEQCRGILDLLGNKDAIP